LRTCPRLQGRCLAHDRRPSGPSGDARHPERRLERSDPPDWKDGHAVLRYVASLLSDALTRVIADRKLPFEHLPNWDCTLSALNRVFGIDLRHHFLHAAPLEWLEEAWLTEPQITVSGQKRPLF